MPTGTGFRWAIVDFDGGDQDNVRRVESAVRRTNIVTRKDLERAYGEDVPLDFVPTHIIRIVSLGTNEVFRLDYVKLGEPNSTGLRFGFVPGSESPAYAVLSSGKWQSLDVHGILHDEVARYIADYVPPSSCEGFVYFVQAGAGGPIKVGWSQDVARRIAELQTANAHRLLLLGTLPGRMEKEAAVHTALAHLRLEGEWFRDAPELRALLRQGR
jgi:hypothetical protein